MTLRFTWGASKAAKNLVKHGISFEIAVRVFLDPFAWSEQDRVEGGETRWQTLGAVEGGTVLLVAHTVQDESTHDESDGTEVIHVISARRAERSERRRYEEERYRQLRT